MEELIVSAVIGIVFGAFMTAYGFRWTGSLINSRQGKEKLDASYAEGYYVGHKEGVVVGRNSVRTTNVKKEKVKSKKF